MSRSIRVENSPPPVRRLCWKMPPLGGMLNPMLHCDREAGHSGRCSWEPHLDACPDCGEVIVHKETCTWEKKR
jgi:hypothetical protein